MTILDTIADHAKERVLTAEKNVPLEEIKRKALLIPKGDLKFENALRKPELSFILECKKASPSKGLISEDFDPVKIAAEYESAGADAVSVLTEPKWFLGNNEYLENVSKKISIPALRKDFVVDEYMIYEAKVLGASAVLLIVSILTEKQLCDYIRICDELGLSALVEIHDEKEAETAVSCGAKIIGVNNRNLKDFSVDTENSQRLREKIPDNVLFVSESGVRCHDDIKRIISMGADAVLIGETLMRSENKKETLLMLKGKSV